MRAHIEYYEHNVVLYLGRVLDDLVNSVNKQSSLFPSLIHMPILYFSFGVYQFISVVNQVGDHCGQPCLTFSEVALPAPVAPLVNNSPANPLPPPTHLDLAQAHPFHLS